MKNLASLAIDEAKSAGANYADVRIITKRVEDIVVRNGRMGRLDRSETMGVGVRSLVRGAWGFASSAGVDRSKVLRTARESVEVAKASATMKGDDVRLSKQPVITDRWQTPYVINPFEVSLEEKCDLLYRIDRILRKKKAVKVAESRMSFLNEIQHLMTTEGTFIEQNLMRSGAGYSAVAIGSGDQQIRSFPSSHWGQQMTMGYELILALGLLENAERVRDEAIALLRAKPCPTGEKDLILGGSQLCLQIHESVGHATELDRVLGMEESFAGRSFATTEKLGIFHYGSPNVNLVADSTVPGGLATIGYDDDGVKAQRWHIVKDGILRGYLTNRELAHTIGEETSRGCNRADGYSSVPIVRITNLSLVPGEGSLDDLIADTRDGVYMDTNRCWSIDQMRLNFQFGCEIGWEVKRGKRTRMLKNPTYGGITPGFWTSCDAICGPEEWVLWGVPTCGKGQPMQAAEMSHGAAPARFRKTKIG